MIIQSKPEPGFIEMVANCLALKFIKPLFLFSTEKNYSVYIGGLAEILDWSMEFYNAYYDNIIIWKNDKNGNDANCRTIMLNELIDSFGNERIKIFYAQNTNPASYFTEKYSAIEL